jgi:hypothetical protein
MSLKWIQEAKPITDPKEPHTEHWFSSFYHCTIVTYFLKRASSEIFVRPQHLQFCLNAIFFHLVALPIRKTRNWIWTSTGIQCGSKIQVQSGSCIRIRIHYTDYFRSLRDQSNELTRGPPELVRHFGLWGEFTSAEDRCMS